jgi:hypothetical protein
MLGYSLEIGVIVLINAALCFWGVLAADWWPEEIALVALGVGQAWAWRKLDQW